MTVLLIVYVIAMIAFIAVGVRFAWRWYRRRYRGKHATHDAFRWQR